MCAKNGQSGLVKISCGVFPGREDTVIKQHENHQLLDNIRCEMCAPIRYNLTRTAKYANVSYQHPGRMTRLKIWYQSYGAYQSYAA